MDIKVEVTPSQLKKVLYTGKNIAIFGNMGQGKSATVYEYIEETGKKLLLFSLAMEMPETIGGIPYAQLDPKAKADYFKKLLDERLKPVIEEEGKDWVIFFDEGNQGSTEVYNTMYGIAHPDPRERNWGGHPIPHAQIVLAGNLSDGTDGTVYINELPDPLLDRFYVMKLKPSKKDATEYLKKKYKNIPQVAKYIKVLLDAGINPRNTERVLADMLEFKTDDDALSILMESKIGTALTAKIFDIQKGIKNLDPAELIKNARKVYEQFKEDGEVLFGAETVTTEAELRSKFEEFLSDEEIAGIMKGDEE